MELGRLRAARDPGSGPPLPGGGLPQLRRGRDRAGLLPPPVLLQEHGLRQRGHGRRAGRAHGIHAARADHDRPARHGPRPADPGRDPRARLAGVLPRPGAGSAAVAEGGPAGHARDHLLLPPQPVEVQRGAGPPLRRERLSVPERFARPGRVPLPPQLAREQPWPGCRCLDGRRRRDPRVQPV